MIYSHIFVALKNTGENIEKMMNCDAYLTNIYNHYVIIADGRLKICFTHPAFFG
jgi:hypothetical protein